MHVCYLGTHMKHRTHGIKICRCGHIRLDLILSCSIGCLFRNTKCTVVQTLNRHTELRHHGNGHIYISHAMLSHHMNDKILIKQHGRNQQRTQKLTTLVDIDGNLLTSLRPCIADDKREMIQLLFIGNLSPKLRQGPKQFLHRTLFHLF